MPGTHRSVREDIGPGTGTCPACGSVRSLDVPDVRGHHPCGTCGLRHAWPMVHPGAEWYAAADTYAAQREGTLPDAGSREPHGVAARTLLERLRPGERLLDLGCGRGDLVAAAANRGVRAEGLELQAELVRIARERGLPVQRAELVRTPWPVEGSFEHVVAHEVLEHLPDPLGFLGTALALLAPGGTLHLSVPAFGRRPATYHPTVDAVPHHLTLWTEEALARLLVRAGARDVQVRRPPLSGEDRFLHHLWQRHGPDVHGWDRRDAWVRRRLLLTTPLLRRLLRWRGPTLLATALRGR